MLPAGVSTALNTFLIHIYTIATDESGHRQEQFHKGFLQDLSDDTQITFYNVADNPEAPDFKFKIYEGTGCDSSHLVHETKPFELLCSQAIDLVLNGVLADRSSQDAICTTVDISGKCVFEQDIQFIYTGPNEVRMEYLNVLLPSDVCNDITG